MNVFLTYTVLGLVIGADLPVGSTVSEQSLHRYVAALVVANDVSARQIQLTKTQFYEAKSYPTFTPAGPWLTLVDAADLARLCQRTAFECLQGFIAAHGLAAEERATEFRIRTADLLHTVEQMRGDGLARFAAAD